MHHLHGYNGIYIDKNITNNNGTLNNLQFTSSSVYIRNTGIYGNVIFISSQSTPSSIPIVLLHLIIRYYSSFR